MSGVGSGPGAWRGWGEEQRQAAAEQLGHAGRARGSGRSGVSAHVDTWYIGHVIQVTHKTRDACEGHHTYGSRLAIYYQICGKKKSFVSWFIILFYLHEKLQTWSEYVNSLKDTKTPRTGVFHHYLTRHEETTHTNTKYWQSNEIGIWKSRNLSTFLNIVICFYYKEYSSFITVSILPSIMII